MCSKTRKCEQLPGWGNSEYGRSVAMPHGRSWELHEDNRGMIYILPPQMYLWRVAVIIVILSYTKNKGL